MNRRHFAKMIRDEFPDIDLTISRFITHGWDHFVLISKDKKVLRIPKDNRYRFKFGNEIKLLKYLKNKVSVGIPYYKYISSTGEFAGYDMLIGKDLTADTFKKLSRKDKELLAEQLGEFLTGLHNIPVAKIGSMCVETVDNLKQFKNLENNIKQYLHSKLSDNEIKLINSYMVTLKETFAHNYTKVLVHNDLSGEHILWDRKNFKVNIIDFSDREIGDPAMDFTGFFEFGEEFAQQVYSFYKGRKDVSFLYRAKLYFKRVPLYIMIDSQQGFPCTFDEGYEMFKKLYK
ncbi:MAG: aminoglycoside phosphotransferase family protein [Candidatus Delongbacteria bacterium]|nr:aminoglycoside phosphotransferase family protein [Candidatus Delongbacteria bacterium]